MTRQLLGFQEWLIKQYSNTILVSCYRIHQKIQTDFFCSDFVLLQLISFFFFLYSISLDFWNILSTYFISTYLLNVFLICFKPNLNQFLKWAYFEYIFEFFVVKAERAHHLFTPQMLALFLSCGQGQVEGTESKFPTWMSGTQLLWSQPLFSNCASARSWSPELLWDVE